MLLTAGGLHAAGTEDEAAQALWLLRGNITRDTQAEGKPVVGVVLSGTQGTDASLKHLKDLKNLQTLRLRGTQ
jgi:hypothetical protein